MHCYASYTQENGYRNNQILQADGKENKFLIGAHQLAGYKYVKFQEYPTIWL